MLALERAADRWRRLLLYTIATPIDIYNNNNNNRRLLLHMQIISHNRTGGAGYCCHHVYTHTMVKSVAPVIMIITYADFIMLEKM